MYLLKVIPLTFLPRESPNWFSYLSDVPINPGAIVKINFRNKKIKGLVLDSEPLSKEKAFLKQVKFSPQKISEVVTFKPIFENLHFQITNELKNFYLTSLANLVNLFLAPLKNLELNNFSIRKPQTGNGFKFLYKENLNFNDLPVPSLILYPSLTHLNYEKFQNLKKDHFLIGQKLTKKQLIQFINEVLAGKDKLFIGPKTILTLPWRNLKAIVLSYENDFRYKNWFQEPYFDYRTIALFIAKIFKIPLIVTKGLSLKSYFFLSRTKPLDFSPVNFKTLKTWEGLKSLILKNPKKRFLIYLPLRAQANKIVCRECGWMPVCEKCQTPLRLVEEEKTSFLFCPWCHYQENLVDFCPICQGWQIHLQKIGIQGLKKFLKEFVPINELSVIEKNKDLENKSQRIVIGSDLVINQEKLGKFDFAIFLKFDSFLSSPEIYFLEKALVISQFLNQISNQLYLKTFQKDHPFLKALLTGKYYQYLLEKAQANQWPPFWRMILIKGKSLHLEQLNLKMTELKNELLIKIKELSNQEKWLFSQPIFDYPPKSKNSWRLMLVIRTQENYSIIKKIFSEIELQNFTIDPSALKL